MRVKKAGLNAGISILSYIISTIPLFIVRKVFLDSLGSEMLGLNSLFGNILTYLSIVEMGIGSAIIFSLYKPFAQNDQVKVKGYLNYYSKFYKIIGIIIFILGIILLPYIKYFIKDNINIEQAKIYFILMLINTVISYLFSYKLCILNVAQEGYKVSIATTISKVIIAILQIIFLRKYNNIYIYVIIQIIINIIYYFVINRYIDYKYMWLKKIDGQIGEDEKSNLIKNISALFMHKIGGVVVFGTDNLVISYFINLNTVAQYNSYNMVFSTFKNILENAMASITPSVGNLLACENKNKAYEVHKRIFFINFWVVSFVIISMYNTITQFISLWLGETQILDSFTVSIILFNLYFQLMRSSVERFKDGSGNYHQDRYAAFIEAVINIVFSIVLVKKIGLVGVFIGTLISNISVVFWIKPKITYKYVFNKPLIKYFTMYFKYLLISIIPFILTNVVLKDIKVINNVPMFITNCILNIIIINGIYILIFWNNKEFKYFKQLIFKIFEKVFTRKNIK